MCTLLRTYRFFPKKGNFENIKNQEIETLINTLNNKPIKRFGYETPNKVFDLRINSLDPVTFIS